MQEGGFKNNWLKVLLAAMNGILILGAASGSKQSNWRSVEESEFYMNNYCGTCLLPEVNENVNITLTENERDENKTVVPWTGIDDDDALAMLEASEKMGLKFVNRLEWGAKPPIFQSQKNHDPADFVVIIDNYGEEIYNFTQRGIDEVQLTQLQDMQMYYLNDIANNFLIGDDGSVYVGRGWMRKPRMPIRHMKKARKSLYVKFLVQFPTRIITEKATMALKNLLVLGVEQKKISENYKIVVANVSQFMEG